VHRITAHRLVVEMIFFLAMSTKESETQSAALLPFLDK
jgi:hypothetical protein